MIYKDELLILSLTNSFICSIPLTALHLLLAFPPRNAEMLTACQTPHKREEIDFVLK